MERMTLSECLHRLISYGVTFKVIREVTKTESQSVGRWLDGSVEPNGETLIRIRWLCWLYDLWPSGIIPDSMMSGLAAIIACNLMSPLELSTAIGYSSEAENVSINKGVFDFILGRTGGMLPEREEKARALIDKYQEKFPLKPSEPKAPIIPQKVSIEYVAQIIEQVADLLEPLLESDDPRERENFRRMMREKGNEKLFEASNMLSAACSENARKIWKRENGR